MRYAKYILPLFLYLFSPGLSTNAGSQTAFFKPVPDKLGIELKTPLNGGIKDAVVKLKTNHANRVWYASANKNVFDVNGLTPDAPYALTVHKDLEPLNGVSVADLVMLNRHVMNLEPLNESWKWVAADVDRNHLINSFDSWQLHQLLLGAITELPNSESYRFIDSRYVYAAFPLDDVLPESIPFVWDDLEYSDTPELVIEGIKIGDLNGSSYDVSLDNSSFPINIHFPDCVIESGEEVELSLQLDEYAQLLGIQFELGFDNRKIQILEFATGDWPGMNSNHIAQSGKHALSMAWFDVFPQTIAEQSAVVHLRVKALEPLVLSEVLKLKSSRIPAIAISESAHELALSMIETPGVFSELSPERKLEIGTPVEDRILAQPVPTAW